MKKVINSILFLFGLHKNPLPKPRYRREFKSDADAIRSDWEKIGKDFENVIGNYNKTQKTRGTSQPPSEFNLFL